MKGEISIVVTNRYDFFCVLYRSYDFQFIYFATIPLYYTLGSNKYTLNIPRMTFKFVFYIEIALVEVNYDKTLLNTVHP